jgi:hypothetical protein
MAIIYLLQVTNAIDHYRIQSKIFANDLLPVIKNVLQNMFHSAS